jgi:cation transport ATPase
MSYFEQLMNSTKYALHKATYNPEADKYAKKQKQEDIKSKKDASIAKLKKEAQSKKDEETKKLADEKAEQTRIQKERSEFSLSRLLGRVLSIVVTIVFIALMLIGGVYGASLAVNLNVYKSAPFRVIYAIWGFLFFWVVIPYVWGYRRFWLGKSPRFYAIMPLVPYRLNHWFMNKFFDWITFRPEDVDQLKEWV